MEVCLVHARGENKAAVGQLKMMLEGDLGKPGLLPWAEAEGKSVSSSSAFNFSPSALPTCHFLTSGPQSFVPLLSTHFTPEQRTP